MGFCRILTDLLHQAIRGDSANFEAFEGFEPRLLWQKAYAKHEAQARGLSLLKENLSPAQRDQYEEHAYFDVTGGKTGRRYRIRHGCQMNVDQVDGLGRPLYSLCFMPEGELVAGDIMLAQKLALELFEPDALEVANQFPVDLFRPGARP